jgi:hypothetical protein
MASAAMSQQVGTMGLSQLAEQMRRQEIFRRWEEMEKNVKSLRVEFKIIREDRIFKSKEEFPATFLFLRKPTGKIFARLDLEKEIYILDANTLFALKPENKTGLKCSAQQAMMWAESIDAIYLFLHPQKAAVEFRFGPLRRFDNHTYLTFRPKKPRMAPSIFGGFTSQPIESSMIVVGNGGNDRFPKLLPSQIRFLSPGRSAYWEVVRWQFDSSELTEKDFQIPAGYSFLN